jgi:periplasmic divalent cation tolerance protein
MPEYIQIITTTARHDEAERIAHTLVDARLAACVQIAGPITSVYHWKAQVETSEEWQCMIKTRANLFDRVAAAIKAVHPYEVPEILAVPIITGNEAYLAWMNRELASD